MMRFLLALCVAVLPGIACSQTAVPVQGPPGPTGPVGGAWAQGSFSADQTTDIAVGDPVKFTTWTGTLSTDPVNYRVTLEAGKVYRISVTVGSSFSSGSGEAYFQLFDVTNAAGVGPFCSTHTASGGTTDRPTSIDYIDATAGDRVLELRIVAGTSNLLSILTAYTWITVVEIGPPP